MANKWAISRTNWARFVKKLHIIGHDFSQKVTNCPRTSRIIPGNHTKTHEDTRFLEKGVKSSEIVRNRSQPLTRAPEPLSSLQILVQISRHRGAKGARRAHFEGKLLKVYDLHRKLSRFFAISAKSCAIHRDDYTGNCPKLGNLWIDLVHFDTKSGARFSRRNSIWNISWCRPSNWPFPWPLGKGLSFEIY